jgi:hypothetical protein
MSHLEAERVACPACGAVHELDVFRSLNGERVPAQVARVLDGTFEAVTCACGEVFRPEHTMLYTHYALRTWIVMHPRADRPRFATIEHGVLQMMEREFRTAPPPVAIGLRGVRPRLVFGQAALSEAVRVAHSGLDLVWLECAKLLVFRRNLATAMAGAPAELLFERVTDDAQLQLGVVDLATGHRRAALHAPLGVIDEAEAMAGELAARYPDLFTRPYASATRYLFGA